MKPTIVFTFGELIEYSVCMTMIAFALTVILLMAPFSLKKASVAQRVFVFIVCLSTALLLTYGWYQIFTWMWS